jgi:membrane associated rhomboid family serine protease
MFVPLHDNTPLRLIRFQYATGLIIVINVLVTIYMQALPGDSAEMYFALSFGAIPALITNHIPTVEGIQAVAEPLTLLTYMFLHGGWLHLISNMLFLWVFADNVEDAFGHLGFVLFYLLCGVAAGLAHAFMLPTSQAPLIGASGAVSGVLAAYLVLFPKARVWVLLFMRIPLRIPAYWALIGWILFQFFSLAMTTPEDKVQVAWWAHIGGFMAGLLLTLLLRNRLMERLARVPLGS